MIDKQQTTPIKLIRTNENVGQADELTEKLNTVLEYREAQV